MTPGERPALPDLDAVSGAGSSGASGDAGLGIFASESPDAAADPVMTAPFIDPTLGGRRRPVGVGAAAAATEGAVVPIRAVLGGRTRHTGVPTLRLRRQLGVAALTAVTLAAGLGSAWTVRAVFANVPHTRAPAVWRMETQGTPVDTGKPVRPTPVAALIPTHHAKASAGRSAASTEALGRADNRGSGSASSGPGSGSGSGHQSRNRSGSGRTSTAAPSASSGATEVHHRKGRGTAAGGAGGGGGGGADDPATHDATPTIGADDNGGGGSGSGSAGNGGGGGGGGSGLEQAQPAATPSALPTSGGADDSSGSGGSSGGGGGGGGGHDDFLAAG